MKIIKFRTWSKTAQQIIPWEELKPKFIKLFDNPEYPYMMFTGLLDKRGVEIYEGDILKTANGHEGIVEYNECQYILSSYLGEYQADMFYKVKNHKAEVIGNIYEHKNLLDKS